MTIDVGMILPLSSPVVRAFQRVTVRKWRDYLARGMESDDASV